MTEEDKVQKIVALVEQSELDPTIKQILIRDLRSEGLTDFLREQIRAYCLEGLKRASAQIDEARRLIEMQQQNPAA